MVERPSMATSPRRVIEVTDERSGAVIEREGADSSTLIDLTELGLPPLPSPIPVPIPKPFLFGARFLIWKQDPTVVDPGVRTVFVDGLILNGPLDARIATDLAGTTPVARNANADFIFTPGTAAFDAAQTWCVAREALTMCERVRRSYLPGPANAPIPWVWNTAGNTDKLTVFPQAGETRNAYYSRSAKALKFFYFPSAGSTVYTCRSLDIVAHETGHAILDGLKPGWIGNSNAPQTGGLHESFGDLMAIFLALSQLDQVEAVIALSKANLHNRNFIAALAEQFGLALGTTMGLRNADNDLKLSQVGNEVHAISQVFTGGIYDVLADIFAFEWLRQRSVKDPALILLEVAHELFKLLLHAIEGAPATNATYADVVNHMLAISSAQGDPVNYRGFIRNRFTLREVVVSPTPLTAVEEGTLDFSETSGTEGEDLLELQATDIPATLVAGQDRTGCCGTMNMLEFLTVDAQLLESGAPLGDEVLLQTETKALSKAFK
jgi:hypothetical protein